MAVGAKMHPLDGFYRWRREYVLPTMCPMVLCRGSCSVRETRCTLTVGGGLTSSCLNSDGVEESLCDKNGDSLPDCCR
jgi:hypothetical protein